MTSTAESMLFDPTGDAPRTRKSRKFSWEEVDPKVVRALLMATYGRAGKAADMQQVAKLSDARLVSQAQTVYGSPPRAKTLEPISDVLRSRWLPTAQKQTVADLVEYVQLGLHGPARTAMLRTKADMVAFLDERNLTGSLKELLRKSFVTAHKTETTVVVGTGSHSRATGSIALDGEGGTGRTPYPFQSEAWSRLDLLPDGRTRADRSGLVVLPTGAGKTFTLVAWLLKRLAMDTSTRVLWLADQTELVDQAAREFVEQAGTLARRERRSMRVVHGRANLASRLAESDIDVVCATRQSVVGQQFGDQAQKRLRRFLERPCIVVVDEAHHAVAPTYQRTLDFIDKHGRDVTFVGLTATPWPSGQGMTRRLRDTFPTPVVEVQVRDLVQSGILARPVIHTVDTNELVVLDTEETKQMAGGDVPPSVLRRLDQSVRNALIVNTWAARADEWGKTLVFACDIEHADNLHNAFVDRGVPSVVVHSRSEIQQSQALKDFRKSEEPGVLVSVGMLLEGVDVPQAKTAFLTRPTKSRVLMRQMIGRVLRGPSAGGDVLANVVDLRDRWTDDVDVLAPLDIPGIQAIPTGGDSGSGEHQLPPVLDELTGEPVSEDVLRRIERDYAEIVRAVPYSPALTSTELAGFYELGHVNVPVFKHAATRWAELVKSALSENWPVWSAIEFFEDLPAPRPARADINEVVDHCRSTQTEPVLVPLRVRFSLRDVAMRLAEGEAVNEADRIARLRGAYESTLARAAYPSFQAFAEAVQQEILVLVGEAKTGGNPESPTVKAPGKNLPKLTHREGRQLQPLMSATVREGREILDADSEDYRRLLDSENLPRVRWTDKVQRGTWAFWTTRMSGSRRGTPEIRLNLQLQAPRTQVPDEMLKFLLWHELCHHVLPGHGHNAEFRRLEALWPDSEVWDSQLDSLVERYDLGWEDAQ